MRKQPYKWAAKSAIKRRVNAIQNFARVCDQKAFSTCDGLRRGDPNTLILRKRGSGCGVVVNNIMQGDMSRPRPVY
jgi:hypothetical protein